MSNYAGTTLLRQYLNFQGSQGTALNGFLQTCLDNAESLITDYTRRNFAGTPGTAYYNRYQQNRVRDNALWLDQDLFSLTGLINGDSQVIPLGSVWLEPRNDAPPYRIVRLKSSYVYVWNTDSDVIVSGTFGYSTTPPPSIVQSTVRLGAYLYRQRDVGITDVAGFQEGGEVTITSGIPSDVRWLLNPFRSRSGGMI